MLVVLFKEHHFEPTCITLTPVRLVIVLERNLSAYFPRGAIVGYTMSFEHGRARVFANSVCTGLGL